MAAAIQEAPAAYQMNAEYSPLYTQLAMQNFNSAMTGPNGYLSTYQNAIAPTAAAAQAASNTTVRTVTVGDINALVPGMVAATRSASPTAASMLDTLAGTATNDLNLGTSLNPAETRQLQESVRAGQAARGVGTGVGDATQEAFAQTDYGQQLYQQRRANATQAAGQSAGFYSGVIPSIGGAAANMAIGSGLSASGGSLAAPTQSSEFNPAGGLAGEFMQGASDISMQNSKERTQAMLQVIGMGQQELNGAGKAASSGGSGGSY